MKDLIDIPKVQPLLLGVLFAEGLAVDPILSEVADRYRAQGFRVAGLVQSVSNAGDECVCHEMHLRDLASGKLHLISEERGPGAMGCHLDWDALLTLAQATEEALTAETSLLIVNRFGCSESEGKGMRGLIEKAMMLSVPVVVAYREKYARNWADFHDGLARSCRPEVDVIISTLKQVEKQAD